MQNLLKNNYILVLSIMLICARQSCLAQNWQIVGGGLSASVGDLNVDTTSNILNIGGKFKYADTLICDGITFWDGNSYNKYTLALNNWNCNCFGTGAIVKWQNRLFMAGDYWLYNNREEYLFEYVNNNWQPSCTMGETGGGLWSIKTINNQLFAFGIFDSLCNKNTQSLAVYNGTDWNGFNLPSPIKYIPQTMGPNYWIKTGEYYKGQYYFGGNFHDGNYKELIRWDGTQWLPLQSGLLGGMAEVTCMKVYKNILYIGGLFYQADGNAANSIVAWDGQNWYNPFPQISYIDYVNDLEVINDELYISGNYIIPNDNDSNMYVLARYNNCNFSVFGAKYKFPDYEKAPSCIAGFKNKIYAAVNDSFLHKSAKYLVSIPDTVSNIKSINVSPCIVNSLKEVVGYNALKIHPNPTSSIINIVDVNNQLQNVNIQIKNYLGQVVFYSSFTSQINLSSLSAGMYFLTIEDKNNKKTVKIIKE